MHCNQREQIEHGVPLLRFRIKRRLLIFWYHIGWFRLRRPAVETIGQRVIAGAWQFRIKGIKLETENL
jgi:hypothetical protein